ncbi:response regulator transcription factor [Candidatus Dojkabacteria bacterium]|nr:response regulator transcription factor [Candidatus Dojkabacteria bacterium]
MTKKTGNLHNPVLLIEDDKNLSFFIKKHLESLGHKLRISFSGDEGLKLALTNRYSLFIVDIGLPGISGFSIVNKIRSNGFKTPIIIITSDITSSKEKESYERGANLFHRKPIDFELLGAQAESLLSIHKMDPVIILGDLYIDTKKRFVSKNNKEIKLSYKEFELLLSLVAAQGDILTRNDLINQTFRGVREVEEGSIDTLVSRVRKKLGKYKDEHVVETVHGVGFRLNLAYIGYRD